jgi:hypothetical protein
MSMPIEKMTETSAFMQAYRGSLISAMRWDDLSRLWDSLRSRGDADWYIYAIGEAPPTAPVSAAQLETFIVEVDTLLRREHEEDYCGIVYADSHDAPTFIKVYDPNNLGVSCGFSDNPPLPGWILSTMPPVDLPNTLNPPGNRRRWWRRIFE